METLTQLQRRYNDLRKEAVRLAGTTKDLSQRAATYYHLYEDSGRNHIFPLIAAHGALWARGYFAFGMKLGKLLSWQYAFSPQRRTQQLDALENFAEAFREVNRRVCVETYTTYHFTKQHGNHPLATKLVRPELRTALCRLHESNQAGIELDDTAKREIFEVHFRDEQATVVDPSITQAVADFRWPTMRSLALMPAVRFAYFPRGRWLQFWKFDRQVERIAHGLQAFDIAAAAGWQHVEQKLAHYQVLPTTFFANSHAHFAGLRNEILATA
ncbi:hypothetical protein DTL42_15480 [Bremerella cremea]|uniref:Uncharacterized protein n=1 Tax=Bremerella cremea TaxID=1031537 RepID=A0A368KRX1_9BACT|nr:hypothetical protein [Bremerella cremea]RCS46368.1 hypothetical protein DTL42_15480 [Bremerella cremea]